MFNPHEIGKMAFLRAFLACYLTLFSKKLCNFRWHWMNFNVPAFIILTNNFKNQNFTTFLTGPCWAFFLFLMMFADSTSRADSSILSTLTSSLESFSRFRVQSLFKCSTLPQNLITESTKSQATENITFNTKLSTSYYTKTSSRTWYVDRWLIRLKLLAQNELNLICSLCNELIYFYLHPPPLG